MPIMPWSGDLDVGVNKMNDEHKILLDYMNKLYDDSKAKRGRASLLHTLEQLAQATVKHFKDEEAYMESIKFEGLTTHKIIHADLLKKFTEHSEAFKKSSAEEVPDKFFEFLKMWLSAHIRGIDVKYGKAKSKSAAS